MHNMTTMEPRGQLGPPQGPGRITGSSTCRDELLQKHLRVKETKDIQCLDPETHEYPTCQPDTNTTITKQTLLFQPIFRKQR